MSRYTGLENTTDEELIRMVCNKDDATALEIELMNRLDYYIEYIQTLESKGITGFRIKPKTRYVEAA